MLALMGKPLVKVRWGRLASCIAPRIAPHTRYGVQCGVQCNAAAYEEMALKIIIVDRPKIYLSYDALR